MVDLDPELKKWMEERFSCDETKRSVDDVLDILVEKELSIPNMFDEDTKKMRRKLEKKSRMIVEEIGPCIGNEQSPVGNVCDSNDPHSKKEECKIMEVSQDEISFLSSTKKSGNIFSNDMSLMELMAFLCLDSKPQITESNLLGEDIMVPSENYSDSDLINSIKTQFTESTGNDKYDFPFQNPEDVYLLLIDPKKCDWENEESVISWLSIANLSPLKLLNFFSDPNEVICFLWELWKRGSVKYNLLINSEHVRGWSIHTLIVLLHSSFQLEFSECFRIMYDKSMRPFTINHQSRGNGYQLERKADFFGSTSIDYETFVSRNILFSMNPQYSSMKYKGVLYKLGIVPFPDRPVYKMDLRDLMMCLNCIGEAWRSWVFWFGDLSNKFTPHTQASEYLINRIQEVLLPISDYLHWIYFRYAECLSELVGIIELGHSKTKELITSITGSIGMLTNLVNYGLYVTARIKYPCIKDLVKQIYESKNVRGKRRVLCNIKDFSFLRHIGNTSQQLFNEGISLSKHGEVSNNILLKIGKLNKPLLTNITFVSRQGGLNLCTKIMPSETVNRSLIATHDEKVTMNHGNVESAKKVLGKDHGWFLVNALHLQSIDSSIAQFSSSFVWSKRYYISDNTLPGRLKDTRSWPTIDEKTGETIPVDGLLSSSEETYHIKSTIGLIGEDENNVIVRYGCFYFVIGFGFHFVSTSLFEAFYVWGCLQYSFHGWEVVNRVSVINEKKEREMKTVLCNIEKGALYLMNADFVKADVFKETLDEEMIGKLSNTVSVTTRKLTKQDLDATTKIRVVDTDKNYI